MMRLSQWFAAVLAITTIIIAGCAVGKSKAAALQTVQNVDLARYMGDWYVIANIPYFAEKNCRDSVESYAPRSDGRIDNWFSCRRGGANAPFERKARAVAKVDNTTTHAEWSVKFFKFISVKYLILDLDTDYQWAVVGHPSRQYGWVLARSKSLPEKTYRDILARLAAQGYDASRFNSVPQS